MDYGEKQHFEDPRDNLNLENWAPERNPRDIGSRAFFSNESETKSQPSDGSLGQIIDLAPAPLPAQPKTFPDATSEADHDRLKSIIGDRFGSDAVTEIHRAENKLDQTKNISDFYDEIRGMAEIATESWVA